ncbi:hypothetical protein JTB14_008627 [Gonioctena quinquepunctata]|nr:hypothetical protein JTB14_008627 [Gonioctena quinquepunctata]
MGRLGRWQIVQKIQQSFWLKWHRNTSILSFNDQNGQIHLFLLEPGFGSSQRLPFTPLKWHLARVVEEHGGIDGITRVVTVKTAKGTLKRPVTKVCPLPSIEH